jgi:heme exporter protein B
MNNLTMTWLILHKDLRCHIRSAVTLIAVPFFALLILVVLALALNGGRADHGAGNLEAGILWVAIVFAGVSVFNQAFVSEKENDCLKGLLLCPVDRSLIYLSKMVANLIILGLAQVFIVPVFILLFGAAGNAGGVILTVALGVTGISAVGTLLAAISSVSRLRDILFPILFFPIIIPLIVAGVGAGGPLLQGQPLSEVISWLAVLVSYDVLFITLAIMVFEPTVEGA